MPKFNRKPTRISPADQLTVGLHCRTSGHAWKPSTAERVVGAFLTVEVCRGCKSERHSKISNTGHVMGRTIRYAENYLSTEGKLSTEDRDRLRLQVIELDYGVEVA